MYATYSLEVPASRLTGADQTPPSSSVFKGSLVICQQRASEAKETNIVLVLSLAFNGWAINVI